MRTGSSLLLLCPTAHTSSLATAATSNRRSPSGTGSTVHVSPSQCSARGRATESSSKYSPTAHMSVDDTALIPSNVAYVWLGDAGNCRFQPDWQERGTFVASAEALPIVT